MHYGEIIELGRHKLMCGDATKREDVMKLIGDATIELVLTDPPKSIVKISRKDFYHSRAWRKLSRLYMAEKNYICERCGAPAVICHHREYLNERNALDKHNLEALCFRCHNEEHFSHAVKFNEAGDPLPPRRG